MMVTRMEKALQKLFILILDPCGKLMMKLNRRTRTALLLAACLLIPIYFILIYSGKFILLSQLTRHLIGLGILLLLLLTSIDGKLDMIRWRRKILWPLLLSGIGILIISFIHPVGSGYRVFRAEK